MGGATGQGLDVRRVPVGLALGLDGPHVRDAPEALAAWPDPERITIVRAGTRPRGNVQDGTLAKELAVLLPLLPLSKSDGVRLFWSRAGAGTAAAELGRLAASTDADLIAPAGDLSVTGFSAL
jgi:hypothetical protein